MLIRNHTENQSKMVPGNINEILLHLPQTMQTFKP